MNFVLLIDSFPKLFVWMAIRIPITTHAYSRLYKTQVSLPFCFLYGYISDKVTQAFFLFYYAHKDALGLSVWQVVCMRNIREKRLSARVRKCIRLLTRSQREESERYWHTHSNKMIPCPCALRISTLLLVRQNNVCLPWYIVRFDTSASSTGIWKHDFVCMICCKISFEVRNF